jgi:hypothetical protein
VKLEKALEQAKHDNVFVAVGDFNASMGIKIDEEDETCGPCCVTHQCAPERKLVP